MYLVDNQLKIEDFIFPYGKLDKNNRWVKLAAIIPWNEFEETYAKKFINNGRSAESLRIALGSLIIKKKYNLSTRLKPLKFCKRKTGRLYRPIA